MKKAWHVGGLITSPWIFWGACGCGAINILIGEVTAGLIMLCACFLCRGLIGWLNDTEDELRRRLEKILKDVEDSPPAER